MALLTEQIPATGVSLTDLIHIVNPNDTSQNPSGSSFKATINQVADAFTGSSIQNLSSVLSVGNSMGPYNIISPAGKSIQGIDGYGYVTLQGSSNEIGMAYNNTGTTVVGSLVLAEYGFILNFFNGTNSSDINSDGTKLLMGNTAGYFAAVIDGVTSGLTIDLNSGYPLYIPNLPSTTGQTLLGITSGDQIVKVTGGTKSWGSFVSLIDQSVSVAGTTYKMSAETNTGSSNIIVSGGSKFVVTNAGVYNIQFSAQLNKSSGTKSNIFIWLSKNNNPVTNSNTDVTLSGGANDRVVAAWNWVDECNAGDYYEIEWTATNNNVFLDYVTSPTYGPGIPSVIVTLTQV